MRWCFFFQAEDGIRDRLVTGVQTCALPIYVRELLKPLGVDDVFGDRHVQFVAKWGTPVPQTFMTDKLDEIVDRRHGIAHTGRAEGVARSALAETTRFLGTLGELVEETVSTVMTDLLQAI